MAAGLVTTAATQLPRLAGVLKMLRPVAGTIARNPIRSLAGVGGVKGFMDQGLGGIIPGAAQGAMLGVGLPLGRTGGAARILSKTGLNPAVANQVAKIGLPLGAAGLAWGTSGGGGGNLNVGQQLAGGMGGGANRVGQAGAGWVAHNTITGETVALDPQSALPQGLGRYGPVGPIGTMFDQIDPSGQYTGRRLGRRLDARTTADELNILAPTIRKWAEQAKKDDLMRSLAAKGVSQNIATNAALTQLAAETGARQATTAANQLGSAITGQYTY